MIKKLAYAVLAVLIGGPVLLAVLLVETRPRVATQEAATAADAQRARTIFREFRALTEAGPGESRSLTVTESDLDSALNFAGRALPRFRGRTEVIDGVAIADGAIGLPLDLWLNGTVEVAPSDTGLDIAYLRVGDLEVPPDWVLPTLRLALDLALGNGMGATAVNGIGAVAVADNRVTVEVTMQRAGRKALAARAKDRVRRAAGLVEAETVRHYWRALDRAAAEGEIHRPEAFTGFLKHSIEHAAARADPAAAPSAAEREMQAALIALAVYCGHRKFEQIVGEVVPAERRGDATACEAARLGGRADLRRHFAISAGLEAASDAGFAFAVGEFKELLDSNRGGSGFSFDDIAADRAGIRFAERMLSAPPADWSARAAALTGESAYFPRVDDLPSGMTEAAFRDRFGDVDSAAYKRMLDRIDTRISGLALFAGDAR